MSDGRKKPARARASAKAPAKKGAAKKTSAKKTASRKGAAKKASTKKTAPKNASAKRTAVKKSAPSSRANRKAAAKTTSAKSARAKRPAVAPAGAEPALPAEDFRVERRGDVAVVFFDVVGEKVNTLKAGSAQLFEALIDSLEQDESVSAIVVASAKKDSFIAGADIGMLGEVQSAEDGARLSREGQDAFARLEACTKRVVAAIDGACLGGGLELALACHGRVASDADHTRLGLPECQLGLLPGAGGTQRLTQLIGVQQALDLLLTGKHVRAKKARRLGLVDAVVPAAIVVDEAVRLARSAPKSKSPNWFDQLTDREEITERVLSRNPIGRHVLFDQARKQLRKKTRGNYPAQERILDVVRVGLEKGAAAGYEAEARAFGELIVTPESIALRSIFHATQALKKQTFGDGKGATPKSLTTIGMLGAGLMGAGIAYVTADKAGLGVR
ncbi:MAG: enoyl-CoA hydratase-related protein, partial [Myxococcota bacterium]